MKILPGIATTLNVAKGFLRGLVRFALYSLLVIYMSMGCAMTYGWANALWQRHYPLETLYERIDAARRDNDLKGAVQIAMIRPQSETQALLDTLLPHAGEFEPSFFFEFSRRYVILDNPPEAIFWAQLGRLRLRYDFLRCNNMLSKELSDKFVPFLVPREVSTYLDLYPEELVPALKRVIDWDEKNPPPRVMLFDCTLLQKMAPNTAGEPLTEESWDAVREALRETARRFINGHDAGPDAK